MDRIGEGERMHGLFYTAGCVVYKLSHIFIRCRVKKLAIMIKKIVAIRKYLYEKGKKTRINERQSGSNPAR